MKKIQSNHRRAITSLVTTAAIALFSGHATADAVTDWNLYAIQATKGIDPTQAAGGTVGIALNSNVATRIEAISARAVFDAVNAINQFSRQGYYYQTSSAPAGITANSASAAAAQAAHDVLLGSLPNTPAWANTRVWLDNKLSNHLNSLGVSNSDPGVISGQAAAAAALTARAADFASIRTTYTPSTNLSVNTSNNTVAVNATGNPGIGLWRPSNGGAGVVNPQTGAPTGFDASGNILATAAIDFNWKNVTPFTLTEEEKQTLVAHVPASLVIGSDEYKHELDYVNNYPRNGS
jgi:hypothetical protein